MALIHGGDIEGFVREYGREPVDFSANCNPLGLPESAKNAVAASLSNADRYPDPLSRKLTEALSANLKVPSSNIFLGSGAADVIFRLALALKPKKALLIAPEFAEYELALNTVGCESVFHYLTAENDFMMTEDYLDELTPDIDMIFLCNPNNPTSRLIDTQLLVKILSICAENNIYAILDECFIGFLDDPEARSMIKHLPENERLVILGAFTKIYGMAGLRLGYCLTSNTELIKAIRDAGQPWSVSSTAEAAGIASLSDTDYIERSKKLIRAERAFLTEGLRSFGMTVYEPSANFIFFKSPIPNLGELCREKGILLRDCSNYRGLEKGYYRIAVRTREENLRLLNAVKEVMSENIK